MRRIGLVAVLLCLAFSAQSFAQTRSPASDVPEQPALLRADQIMHDRDLNTVTASGHVQVDQGGRILLADTLSYNLKQDVIVASGHVSLTSPGGEVTFADYIELSADMRDAVAQNIRLLLIDDSRLGASRGRRIGGTISILDNAVYTACQPCAEHPEEAPLWDVRAKSITLDQEQHKVIYRDAWIEAKGIPFLYTPYFSHPDPSIKRASGLLFPQVISNRIIGTGAQFPYFYTISPYQDVTLNPLYTSKQGPGMAARHRVRFMNGEVVSSGSAAREPAPRRPGEQATGWHFESDGAFDLSDTWRAGWNVEQASDHDYMRYYNYRLDRPYLTTRPYIQNFSERNYAALEAYSFQSQTDTPAKPLPGVPNQKPLVLPLVTYSYVGQPGGYGDYVTFDTHAASVNRVGEQSSRRVNTLSAWHVPWSTQDGQLYNFTTSLRADAYNSDHLIQAPGRGTVNSYRALPQASVNWRYPFAKVTQTGSQTVTPLLLGNLGPQGGNPNEIPNEDSLDFELDDMNIFSPTPFSGYDRVAAGPRIAFGGEYSVTRLGGQSLDILLGQSFQPVPSRVFQRGSGLDGYMSDYVGRVQVSPSRYLNFNYRFRLDQDDFSMRRGEVDMSAGPKALNFSLNYVFLGRLNNNGPYDQREQIAGVISAQLSRYWSAQFYTNQNLGLDAGPLASGGRLVYDDECLSLTFEAGVRQTYVNSLVAGHYAVLTVNLKTLTQIPFNLSR